MNQPDEAVRALDAVDANKPDLRRLPFNWLEATLVRAEIELARRRADQAIELATEVRGRIADTPSRPYFKSWEARATLIEGKGHLLAHHPSEALPLLRRAVETSAELFDEHSPVLADAQVGLANGLADLKRWHDARALLRRAKAIHATHKQLSLQYTQSLHALDVRLVAVH